MIILDRKRMKKSKKSIPWKTMFKTMYTCIKCHFLFLIPWQHVKKQGAFICRKRFRGIFLRKW